MSAYIRYRRDFLSSIESRRARPVSPAIRLPSSRRAADFADRLRDAAGACTVGIRTLSGLSAKSVALDRAARDLGALPIAAEQDAALAAILAETATLWPDQAACLLAGLIDDLLHRGLGLDEGVRLDAGPRLLGAALLLAPSLLSAEYVSDTPALDRLNRALTQLAQQKDFRFGPDVFDRLDSAGLCGAAPGAEQADADARALRGALAAADPAGAELAWFAERAGLLPAHLRGRVLALLVNMLGGPIWLRAGFEMIGTVGEMIHDLPPTCRITTLEAFHNQIGRLPGESARFCHALVSEAAHALPQGDALFGRTRRDLIASLSRQGEALGAAPAAAGAAEAPPPALASRPGGRFQLDTTRRVV